MTAVEYEKLRPGLQLTSEEFEELREFALGTVTPILDLGEDRQGPFIRTRQYVGMIALPCGTVLELLPKICQEEIPDREKLARRILLAMLMTTRMPRAKHEQIAGADTGACPMLEVFVRLFLVEVQALCKRGLPHRYETVEENLQRHKGKLLLREQMRQNYLHPERCYVAFDEFTANCPETRLIKTTLLLLRRWVVRPENQRDIRALLSQFISIPASQAISADVSRLCGDRTTAHASAAVQWCRVFLQRQSFLPYSGKPNAMALLFPMERLYEEYTAVLLRRVLPSGWTLQIQDRSRCLFRDHQVQLQPDLVLTRRSDHAIWILDTKWKLLWEPQAQPEQADLYQLFAYQHKYRAVGVVLLCPQHPTAPCSPRDYTDDDGTQVLLRYFDLSHPQESLRALLGEWDN